VSCIHFRRESPSFRLQIRELYAWASKVCKYALAPEADGQPGRASSSAESDAPADAGLVPSAAGKEDLGAQIARHSKPQGQADSEAERQSKSGTHTCLRVPPLSYQSGYEHAFEYACRTTLAELAAARAPSNSVDCSNEAILASAHEAIARVRAACDEHADIDSEERFVIKTTRFGAGPWCGLPRPACADAVTSASMRTWCTITPRVLRSVGSAGTLPTSGSYSGSYSLPGYRVADLCSIGGRVRPGG
jgi:hypothetical protein